MTGTAVEASVTGSVTGPAALPAEMALTPSRFCQADDPSTIPPLTTYVAAGSSRLGSYPIEKPRFVGSVIGRTWRATSVPVSTLMSAAIETAAGPSAVAAGGTMVPVIVAAEVAGTDARVSAIPLVGPPVMTGSPVGFCQVLVPSTMVANRA